MGSKEFIGRVKQRLWDKARVEEEKPESRRLFSPVSTRSWRQRRGGMPRRSRS
jgi:hypothetical protein